jgi:hypothetical protein
MHQNTGSSSQRSGTRQRFAEMLFGESLAASATKERR